jgi:hypothetical protein
MYPIVNGMASRGIHQRGTALNPQNRAVAKRIRLNRIFMIASKISHLNPRFTIGIARLSPERGILMIISGIL